MILGNNLILLLIVEQLYVYITSTILHDNLSTKLLIYEIGPNRDGL